MVALVARLHNVCAYTHNVCVCLCQLSEQHRIVCMELRDVTVKLDKELDQEKRAQRERNELQREKQRLEEQMHKIGQEKEEIKQDREDLR